MRALRDPAIKVEASRKCSVDRYPLTSISEQKRFEPVQNLLLELNFVLQPIYKDLMVDSVERRTALHSGSIV